jgi:5'-methylthioadenosine nucleosidase
MNSNLLKLPNVMFPVSVSFHRLRKKMFHRLRQNNKKMSSVPQNHEKEIKHIAILMAMEAEGKPYIDSHNLEKIPTKFPHLPCAFYQGEFNGGKVTVVLNGKDKRYDIDCVGTTPGMLYILLFSIPFNGFLTILCVFEHFFVIPFLAAISTFMALTEIQPDLVINAGTAGGFRKRTAEIGDVFLSTSIKHHDRRIPIPGFVEYGRGNHQAHFPENLIKAHGYKSGIVTTSNSLDHTEMDDIIMEENQASVKEMEAASIAWVVEQFQVPFFAVKVITDIGKFFFLFSLIFKTDLIYFFYLFYSGWRPPDQRRILGKPSFGFQITAIESTEDC